MPTFRIMETNEFPDAIFYRARCDCGTRECDLSLMLEHNPHIDDIILTMHQDLHWNAYWEPRWYLRPWLRLKVALRVLLTGFIQVESSFLFGDREQIKAFVQALNKGMEKLEGLSRTIAGRDRDISCGNKKILERLIRVDPTWTSFR